MKLHTTLRILICAEVVLLVAVVAAELLLQSTLPEPLQRYLEDAPDFYASHPVLACGFTILDLIALFVSWIGLWRLWNPARFIFLGVTISPLFLLHYWGPYVFTFVSGVIGDLSLMATGGILVLIFCTDLREQFRNPPGA